MKRCKLVIPDAGPLNSLWVADQLPLLLVLDMPIVLLDVVYDEATSDTTYLKDREVKAFIDGNQPPFCIEETDTGRQEREKRRNGLKVKKNAGEIAIADFMSAEDGLRKHLSPEEPVLVLFEDSGLRVFNKPPHLHLLSTVALLRGLEKLGFITSADEIIHCMTHPVRPDRRPSDSRTFSDLPAGVDEPAAIGSAWEPGS